MLIRETNFLTIADGFTKVVKLTALRQNPNEIKYIQDEFDMLDGIEFIRKLMKDTAHLVGKPMHKGESTFDFVLDIKNTLEEIYLYGEDQQKAAIARKKHGALYHLVLAPIVDALGAFSHEEALQNVDTILDEVRELILNNNIKTHMDDAVVMKEIVRQMTEEREAARKANSRKRKPRKVVPEVVLPMEEEQEPEVEELVL